MNAKRIVGLIAAAGVAMLGAALTYLGDREGHISVGSLLLSLGLTMIIVSAILGVGVFMAKQNVSLDDAFASGYRAGFKQGRRTGGLRVVPFNAEEERSTRRHKLGTAG